ncbi:LTA synthase family protein [Chitinibacter sp. GC72]|uniref:LTA synthase family protein n=1 Tax=Chitinibacter sp. GC72 TaxID=1526917 RepID=UPI0012F77BA4|nr:LTA synthase family protein [Chitinibacter sp. GC72]
MKWSFKFPPFMQQKWFAVLAIILMLLLGRFAVDGQWNIPRIGFSALLYLFFAMFLNRWAAVWATLSLEALLYNISYVKNKATGEPLLGRDLLEVGQGMALTSYIDWDIIGYGVGTVAAIALGLWFRPKFKARRIAPGLMLCAIVGVQFDSTGLYAAQSQAVLSKTLSTNYVFYNFRENVKQNGILGHLILSAESMHLPKSGQHDFYTRQLPAPAGNTDPDIVVVMCESCYTSSDEKMPTPMNRLSQAGFVASRIISPVYGGGTADAEFEALTGLSSLALPGIDFQNFSDRYDQRSATLVSELKNHGYLTTGMHNYYGSFYKRAEVYPKFGFDHTRFVDKMKWNRKAGWPKDSAMYDVALEQYRSAPPQQKQLMFLVTVSTHGPFIANQDAGLSQYRARLDLAVSDLLAFNSALQQQAKARGRELIVVVFGDHKPALNKEFVKSGILPPTMFEVDHKGALAFKNQLSPQDHRIRGDVPLYIASSRGNQADTLASELADKPLFCLPASLSRQTSSVSPFFNAVAERCQRNEGFYTQGLWWRNIFPEGLYAERLFGNS